MKKKCIAFIIVGILLCFQLCVQASERADVVITNMSFDEEYAETFESKIKIQFFNRELYNDEVYLSYHIYDASNYDIIQYENQRIKINLNEKGEMISAIAVDLKEIFRNTENVVLRYDIVDQGKLYWFADNEEICFSTTSINCRVDRGSDNIRTLINGVTVHPVIFTINVFVAILTIGAIIYIRIKSNKNDVI